MDSDDYDDEEEVWQHFVRLDGNYAQCGHCEKKLACGTSLVFLRGHLKRRHPTVIKKKQETPSKSVKGGADEDSGQLEKDNPGMRRCRAGVWQHFVRLNKTSAQCKVCKRDLNYSASITNLKRHLKLKHLEQHTQLTSTKVSFSWQKKDQNPPEKEKRKRSTKLSAEDLKDCIDENEILNSDSEYQPETDDSDNLQVDLKGRNPKRSNISEDAEKDDSDSLQTVLDEARSRLLGRRKSDLWNHFSALDKEIARCHYCNKNLNYRSSATNLRRHLRIKHTHAHDQLEKAKNASKETGASSGKEPTPSKTNWNEKSPGRKKNVVHKSDRNTTSSEQDTSDEDSFFDNGMSDDVSDEDSADESHDENSPKKGKQRTVSNSEDAFSRIANRNEVSFARKGAIENRKHITSVPAPVRPKKVHAKRKRSRLWDFFTVIDEKFAECNTCKHRLVHKSGLSNLAKHYTMKHSTPSTDQQNSTVQAAGMPDIQMAGNTLNHNEAELPPESHPIENSGDPQPKRRTRKKTSDNHWRCAIWKLFEKQDETFSQCRSCLKRISHRSTNANLLKHTRIKHPDIYYKFEERLKDFSHNVNILVDHFFPESLITASASNNNAPQPVPSHEPDHMPHQEYQMSENPPPHMYDNMQSYSFPVIFVQEEEAVPTSSETIAATSVITSVPSNSIHAPPTSIHTPPINVQPSLPGPSYSMGGHTIISPQDSAHLSNHVQDPAPLNMNVNAPSNPRANLHQASYMVEGGVHNVGVVGNQNVGVLGNQNVGVVGNQNVGVVCNQNVGVVSSHHVGGVGPYPGPLNGNYQQVLTTSFMGGGVVQSSDRLIGMVEESNQLLRGMQSAIERQSDALVRLAESIATGMRSS